MLLENVEYAKTIKLKDIIEYQDETTKVLKFIDNAKIKIAFISLDINSEIKEHITTGDALYYCIEGKVLLTSNDKTIELTAKDAMVISKGKSHSGKAVTKAKLMLIVIREDNKGIINIAKDVIVDIKSIVDNSRSNIDLVNTDNINIFLKDLDNNETIERIVGNEEVLLINLEGETDIRIDDNFQRLNSETLIAVENNTIYAIETATSTKVIIIKISL